LSDQEDPPQPQHKVVWFFALRPLTPGNHHQSGSEQTTTFTVLQTKLAKLWV